MVLKVQQREIIEVPFSFPDGEILVHPALVISCNELQDVEEGMFYAVLISSKNHNPELTVPIQNEWLSKPLSKKSFFVTHLIDRFNTKEVINRYNCFLRQPYFDDVVDRVISNIIDGEFTE